MKPVFVFPVLVLSVMACAGMVCAQTPAYDHVVIVTEENHGYNQIINSADAPYINGTLATNGVLITNAYGEQHPSQPNYFWLFSGSNQGITGDKPYWSDTPGPVFSTGNIYTALQTKFSSTNFFGGYVDSGTTGTPVTNYYQPPLATGETPPPGYNYNYANRHVPWLGFTNINGGNPASITQDFATQFPSGSNADYSSLPKVSFVTPALNHDMHDYNSTGGEVSNTSESSTAVQNGDAWLSANLGGYAEWARSHNSLLIVTWDEDSTHDWQTPVADNGNGPDGGTNPSGLTAPDLGFKQTDSTSGPNQIAMLFYGANLAAPGAHAEPGAGVNNVNLLRTVESFYELTSSGDQSVLATAAGMSNNGITDIFTVPEPSALCLIVLGCIYLRKSFRFPLHARRSKA